MSIARQKIRFLLLVSVFTLLIALAISLTWSGGLAQLGIILWHNMNHMLARGPDVMSHWP